MDNGDTIETKRARLTPGMFGMCARQRDKLYGESLVYTGRVEELRYDGHALKRVNETIHSHRHDTFLHEIKRPLEVILSHL